MKKIRTHIQTEKNTHTQRKYIYINILKDIYIRRGKPHIHTSKFRKGMNESEYLYNTSI